MTAIELLLGGVVYAIGCTLQGILGFGAGLFAVPILVLINPGFVPGPILLINPLMGGIYAWRERDYIDWKGLKWILVGRIPGIALGVIALTLAGEEKLELLFGILLLSALGVRLVGIKPTRNPKNLTAGGCLSGFMGTAVSVGGPPIALLYHDVSGSTLRATLSPYFLIGSTISIGALATFGHFGTKDLIVSLWLIPALLVGALLSKPLTKILDRKWITPGIYTLSGIAALTLLLRSLGS